MKRVREDNFIVRLPTELSRPLRDLAAAERRTITVLAAEAVRMLLAQRGVET